MAFTLIPLLGSFSLEWHGQDSVIQLEPPHSSVLYQWFCWRQEHMYYYYGFKCISGCTSHLVFLFQYIHTCIHTYIWIIYILSCLTWTRTVGAHWRLRVISFGCRLSATAGLLREMYGSQGVRAQAGKKSLLLRSVCCILPLFLASVYFSLVFHPLFKPQMPNDTPTDTTFPSGCCQSPLVASSFSVCF